MSSTGLGPDTEEARERRFWRCVWQVSWSVLLVLGVLTVLVSAAFLLDWGRYLVLALLGLLAGVAIAVAMLGSARGRQVTGLVLGAFVLPLLAMLLGAVAVRSEAEFVTWGSTLLPFLAWAAGAVAVVPALAWIWRPRPEAGPAAGEGKGAPP